MTLRTAVGTRAGRIDGDVIVELGAPDVGSLLAAGLDPVRMDAAISDGPFHDLRTSDLAPVVPRPGKVLCVGLNYASHIREMGREPPEYPTLFAKFAEALIGPKDPIVLPSVSDQVDWEAELAIVIGRPARHVPPSDASEHIFGFTILNDVSIRDWQGRTPQWLQGKTFEATTPVGPALVTPDEIDGASDLLIRCEVDGQTVQEARTSDLWFSPSEIVAYTSEILTLHPGDLIATGTPAGVGAGRDPQVFLRPGQIVRTTIEGLGELVNVCVREHRDGSPVAAST